MTPPQLVTAPLLLTDGTFLLTKTGDRLVLARPMAPSPQSGPARGPARSR